MGRDPTTVVRIILEGGGITVLPNDHTTFSMPCFAAMSDHEIADVATYIRNAWGNRAPAATAKQVADLRKAIAP